MAEAVAEGVRMRKAGETVASQPTFYRYLRDVGVNGEHLTIGYSAFRNYVRDVCRYDWPYERSRSAGVVTPVSRSR